MSDVEALQVRAKALLARSVLQLLKNTVEVYEIVDAAVDQCPGSRGRIYDANARIKKLTRLLANLKIAEETSRHVR